MPALSLLSVWIIIPPPLEPSISLTPNLTSEIKSPSKYSVPSSFVDFLNVVSSRIYPLLLPFNSELSYKCGSFLSVLVISYTSIFSFLQKYLI